MSVLLITENSVYGAVLYNILSAIYNTVDVYIPSAFPDKKLLKEYKKIFTYKENPKSVKVKSKKKAKNLENINDIYCLAKKKMDRQSSHVLFLENIFEYNGGIDLVKKVVSYFDPVSLGYHSFFFYVDLMSKIIDRESAAGLTEASLTNFLLNYLGIKDRYDISKAISTKQAGIMSELGLTNFIDTLNGKITIFLYNLHSPTTVLSILKKELLNLGVGEAIYIYDNELHLLSLKSKSSFTKSVGKVTFKTYGEFKDFAKKFFQD